MRSLNRLVSYGVLVWFGGMVSGLAQSAELPRVAPAKAPPPALRWMEAPPPANSGPEIIAATATMLYSIGEPTDEEQLHLEFINRARANPPAEGLRLAFTTDPEVRSAMNFFLVDTNALVQAFNAIAPAPPLAFNERLINAARWHSLDMFTNAFQEHVSSDGRTLGQRATAAGYNWSTLAENVFSFAESPWHGHAGFAIDWGFGPGGMQNPPGHRNSIHNAALHEIGVGVVKGTMTVGGNTVGPQLVTQDFGNQPGARPFLTGVVYYDLNTNGAYDPGEGLRGVRVEVSGVAQYAVSAGSGGYTVPASNGGRTVTFSGFGLEPAARSLTFAGNNNVKADLALHYVPPVISGATSVPVNSSHPFSFSAVPGVSSYEVMSRRFQPHTLVEGAEEGATNFIVVVPAGEDPVVTGVSASGARAFHLATPDFTDQSLTLNRILRPGTNAALVFASRLGWATAAQVARVQVTANDGLSWVELWSRTGTGSPGQTGFARVTNSLAAFAGQEIRCRFLYDFTGGSAFTQTGPGYGWYLDDIAFLNTQEVGAAEVQTVTGGTNFVFQPAVPGSYALRVRPRLGNGFAAFGPALDVAVEPESLSLRIVAVRPVGAAQVQIDVQVLSGTAVLFGLEWRNSFAENWVADSDAVLTTVTPGGVSRFTTSTGGSAQRFFRVKGQ